MGAPEVSRDEGQAGSPGGACRRERLVGLSAGGQ